MPAAKSAKTKPATAKVKKVKKPEKSLTIREARSDADYHKTFPIIKQLLPHLDMQVYAQRMFVARATGYRVFVGVLGKEIVGMIGLISNHNLHDGFTTYIEHVVIDEAHQGNGYGTKLIQFAEQRAREEGCKLIELDTDIGAEAAEMLYAKNGYVIVGKYYQKNIDKFSDPIFYAQKKK